MLISDANVPRRGNDVDEVLEREPLDRLADWRAPHLQLVPEPVLVDRRAGRDLQRHDPVAQLDVRAIGQQLPRCR